MLQSKLGAIALGHPILLRQASLALDRQPSQGGTPVRTAPYNPNESDQHPNSTSMQAAP